MLKFIINCRVCGLDEEVEADSEEVAKIGFREHHKTVSPSCPLPASPVKSPLPRNTWFFPQSSSEESGEETGQYHCPAHKTAYPRKT